MKFTNRIVVFLVLICSSVLLVLVSCQNKSENKYEQLGKMDWLTATWENKMPEGTLKEIWVKENDSTFSARSFFIKEEDTLHNETILLSQKNDVITYSAKIIGENNDKFIDFKLTTTNENSYTFENPSHDYPQKIMYKKVDNNNLVATISGIQGDKLCSDSYPMKRK
jgi:hypothetical protein